MGRVDSSKTSVGNSMSKDGVGGMDSAKTKSVSVSSKSSISKSSIWVSISAIQDSGISLSVGLSFPLLAAAGNRGSQIVGADTNIGGVGQTKRGSSNSMDWVGESSCGESSISQMAKTSISQTSKSQTSISGMSGIGVSIGAIQNSGISLSLRLSLGFPLANIVTSIDSSIGIWVSGVSKGSSSTGNRDISRVHTRTSFATEGEVRTGSIAVGSIEDSSISISFSFSSSVGSSHKGRGDNKELHIE